MFEKNLKDLSNKLGGEEREYLVLTHKKHKREIYFRNNPQAVRFIKSKLGSFPKNILYLLLKLHILQRFIKTSLLSEKLGDVIYFAGQIKSFNLNEGTVMSFPTSDKVKVDFIKSKEFQEKISKGGFSPEIIKIDKEVPYSLEKLGKVYEGRDAQLFGKLMAYYGWMGIKNVSVDAYVEILLKKLKEENIKFDFVKGALNRFKDLKSIKLLVTEIHGDFARENVLTGSKGEPLFIDWNPRKGVITEDFVNLFRSEEDLLENREFIRLSKKLFPKEVLTNMKLYIILGEMSLAIVRKKFFENSIKRIKRCV